MDLNVQNSAQDERLTAAQWVWDLDDLDGPQRLVLLGLVHFSIEMVCVPSVARLPTITGLTVETYNSAIDQLAAKRLITLLVPYVVPTYRVNAEIVS